MNRHNMLRMFALLIALAMVLAACGTPATPVPPTQPPATQPPATEPPATQPPATEPPTAEQFVFGLLMVGPYNDHGWSQAHYEAGQYVEQNTGAKMVYIDKVNTADRPGTTPAQ